MDMPERIDETRAASEGHADEAAELRARILSLEADLNMMRAEVNRLKREQREERRRDQPEGRDRVDTVREIVERVDNEGRRLYRAMVLSQVEQMRLTADLIASFAERVERDNPPDSPDLERDLPRDVLDGFLDAVDRSLEIPEKTIERFEETYKQAGQTRRSREARSG